MLNICCNKPTTFQPGTNGPNCIEYDTDGVTELEEHMEPASQLFDIEA